MTEPKITLITEPTVIVMASQQLEENGLRELTEWVRSYRPECLPDEEMESPYGLFPHLGLEGDRKLTGNELLVELSGRNCYHSYGLKAGRKDNREYVERMINPGPGMIQHASVAYHAKMTFFVAGISRRVSHELIRHYVGADRSEEGSPSQESTRYTFHPGHFAVPPRVVNEGQAALAEFSEAMTGSYKSYLKYIEFEVNEYKKFNGGKEPTMIDRKRIFEAAAGLLPMQACTSLMWTTNPVALAKLFRERCDSAADLEFNRLAVKWRDLAYNGWPNLFYGQKS